MPTGGVPALVPGDIHDDLERAGLLAPNNVGLGDPRWIEVASVGWRYRTEFAVPKFGADDHLWLGFDGVDFSCRVIIDGAQVGEHSGMFTDFVLDIASFVVPGSTVTLEVEIDPMPEGIAEALRAADGPLSGYESPDFFVFVNNRIRRELKDLKSPTAGSYDWGVNTWTIGIWRDVWMRVTGPATIEHLRVDATVEAQGAKLECTVDLASSAGPAAITITVTDPAGSVVASGAAEVQGGGTRASMPITISDPELWWPTGHGAQPLYTVTATVQTTGRAAPDDRASKRVGIRTVEWAQVNGADENFINPFRLLVNGVPIRTMGSNLVPPDLLYGRIGRDGNWLLHAAIAAGFNTLRLWGGGVLMPDAFYDLADELGVLLLQELFLANSLPESDPVFLSNLDTTVRSVVRRIRHHPSIIEWGGGNEMLWNEADTYPALETMRRSVADEDDRVFRATCPMEGSRHSPWHFDPKTSYGHYDDPTLTDNLGSAPLMRYGEFGAPSPAHLEVWERDIPEPHRWPIDSYADPVLVRKNVFSAAFGEEFWLMPSLVEELFGLSRSLPDLIRAGQFLGAEGLRYSIDALRRRGVSLGGFTTWDFNEPWPNGAGSYLVDYDGRPMLSHAFVQEAMSPVSVSLVLEGLLHEAGSRLELPVVLTSDAASEARDLRWTARAFGLDGSLRAEGSGAVARLESLESVDAGSIALQLPADGSPILLHVRLEGEGELLTERLQVLGASSVHAPLSGLLPENRFPAATDLADAGTNPANADNLAAAVNGGRILAVSGSEARSTDPSLSLIDGDYSTQPDRFDGVSTWRSTTEDGWVELELARHASVTRICVGRDRSGIEHDRTLDAIAVSASTDGEHWSRIAAFDRLAPLLGDRIGGDSLRPASPPTWTLEVRVPPTAARYLRLDVRGRRGNPRFVALDQIEVYADPSVTVSVPTILVRDHRESDTRLARTELRAERLAQGQTASGLETLTIRVHNAGPALALFCEVSAADTYRPRVLVDGAAASIPPGEYRDLTLMTDPAHSAPIGASDWRVRAWNSAPVVVT